MSAILRSACQKAISEMVGRGNSLQRWMELVSNSGGGNASSYRRSFVQADLVASKLTVTHGLGQDWGCVSVYNNSRRLIIATEITSLNANQIEIDLSSFSPIQGTWNLVVIA